MDVNLIIKNSIHITPKSRESSLYIVINISIKIINNNILILTIKAKL